MIDPVRLKPGMRVRYITDVATQSEAGTVTSWNTLLIFVRYDSTVHRQGFQQTTSAGTFSQDLVEIDREYNDRLPTYRCVRCHAPVPSGVTILCTTCEGARAHAPLP